MIPLEGLLVLTLVALAVNLAATRNLPAGAGRHSEGGQDRDPGIDLD